MTAGATETLPAQQKRRDGVTWGCCLAGCLAGLLVAIASYSAWAAGFAQRQNALDILAASRGGGQEIVVESPGANLQARLIARIPVQHPDCGWKWHVDVAYLGHKNPQSRGEEVWLLNVAVPRPVDWEEISHVRGWELLTHQLGLRDNTMVASGGPPRSAMMDLTGGTLLLQFLKHERGGMVRVAVNGISRTVDLYSPTEGTVDMVWQPGLDANRMSPPQLLTTHVTWPESGSRSLRIRVEPAGRGDIRSAKFNGVPMNQIAPDVYGIPGSCWSPRTWAALAALLTFVLVGLTVTLLALLWCAALPARPRLLAAAGLVSAITIAAFWTAVCFPGTLSQDSLDMWSQALHGKYNSWHPLGMTLAMRGVHRLLATWPMQCQVAAVAFLQGTMLWCAIFAALTLFIRPVRLRIAACAAPLLYYPLWLYTVTLWKDVWFAAAFLGLLCAAWPLLAGSTITRWRWLAVSTLLWLTLLNRSSATITFLALMVLPACVFAALRRFRPARRILALGSAALVCAVLGQNVLYKMLHVTGSGHLLDFYLAYDLVGTVKFSERPITRFANLQTYQAFGRERFERAVNGYSCGVRAGYLYWGPNPPFDQWALLDDSYALQDMPLLVLGFPGPYLKQKVCSLKSLLGVSGSQIDMPFQDSVVANRFGLASESLLPPVRERVAGFLDRASGSPGPLQLPFRHYALLALGAFAGLLAIGVAWYRGNVLAALPAIYLFTGGMAILLPWLVIIPSSDWRYLMPATTCWICGILASAASFLRDPAAPDCVSPGFSGPSSQT